MTTNTEADVSVPAKDSRGGLFFNYYPVMIPTALKFQALCKGGAPTPYDIFTIINADPVLTGITYGLYHELFPAVPQDFFGIPYIIIKLNVNTVKNNVSAAAERAILSRETGKRFRKKQKDFLRRSLSAGIVSLLLAKRRGLSEGDTQKYYCAGLLHDIGAFVLSKESGAVFDGNGVSRAEAGRITAKLWGFPPVLCDAVAFHTDYRNYTGDHRDVVFHTALAVSVLDKLGPSGSTAKSRSRGPVPDELLKGLELDENILDGIEKPFGTELKKASAFIGLEKD
ncbi:MAG: HDOD domain-containing protein [Spirochaetaceae bacterium]|jgi:HD-like signal output (HDOD) protein|nr:HDOD domain-containing protein [Spirochaetaceae bacterium]